MEICQTHLGLLRLGENIGLLYVYAPVINMYHKLFHCRGNVVEIVLNLATVTLVRLVCVGTARKTVWYI